MKGKKACKGKTFKSKNTKFRTVCCTYGLCVSVRIRMEHVPDSGRVGKEAVRLGRWWRQERVDERPATLEEEERNDPKSKMAQKKNEKKAMNEKVEAVKVNE